MTSIISKMLINLLLTIIIEIAIALILKVRNRKDIINIIIINCITNPIVNYFMLIVSYLISNNIIIYTLLIVFELLVIYSEYKYYKNRLIYKKINPIFLSFIFNIISVSLGFILLK